MENKPLFYDGGPTLSYSPSISDKVIAAYNKKDWRALNKLQVVWWDQYDLKWCKFGPQFWDAG
jgi:hypothetical protein